MSTEIPHKSWQSAVIAMSGTFIGLVVILALSWGKPILVPIALATLLTFLLNPVVRSLQTLGLGRLLSVMLAVLTVGLITTTLVFIGSRQISTLISELPANTEKIKAKVHTLKTVISGRTALAFEEMIEEISQEIRMPAKDPSDQTVSNDAPAVTARPPIIQAIVPNSDHWMYVKVYLGSALEVMATLMFTFVLLVFFLLEREGMRDRIVLLAGKTRLTLTSKALEDATNRVSRYIAMVALVNGGFGLLLTMGLFCLGVPYAILWGCVAALLRFIPYIGPWVGAFFPITMSLAMSEGWWQPISVFAFVMVLELVANNVVEPIVFGRTIGIAPAALLISAAFWLYMWGPIGLVLSAPFAVCLAVIGKNIPQLRFLNILLGDEPAFSANIGFYQRLLVRDRHEAAALVVNRLAVADSEHVYDELLIPALNFARRDVQRGHLTVDDCNALLLVLSESFPAVKFPPQHRVENSTDQIDEGSEELAPKQLTLLACAADGEVDRTAIEMLREILDPTHWNLELTAEGMLTSEIAQRVATDPPAAICIASLPPDSIAHARYLCKKLRAASHDIPIIIGRWGQPAIRPLDRDRLLEAGASEVTSTLVDTRQWLRSHYPFLESTAANLVEANSHTRYELAPAIPR